MPHRLRSALVALCLLAVAGVPAVATAPRTPLSEELLRVFPEPLVSADYVQFGPDPLGRSQYLDGIAELERRYPDVIRVDDIGELTGKPGIRSRGGRPMPVVTVTDLSVDDEEKVDLFFSMSIHGLERAGLEGSLRFIEDVGIAWAREKAGGAPMVMANGDPSKPAYTEMTTSQVLKKARLLFVNLNPDGWAAGDRHRVGTGYKRGNDNGNLDLNRQWPTIGWARSSGSQYDTMSEPEAQAGRALIEEYLGVPEGAADLHGQFADDVLLAIMFPAGQFDPLQLTKQVELADAIKYNVNHSVHPGAAGLLSGLGMDVQPAEFHTAYDAIGYDDSGFMGDYLVQQGILEMDHEYIFSNLVPNHIWVPELTQIHVDTTRELLKATIVTTIVADEKIDYTAEVGGAAAYVRNPEVLTEAGATVSPGFGHAQEPYTSTSMRYWEDLGDHTTTPIVPITSDAIAAGADLSDYSTVVVTDRRIPRYETGEGELAEPEAAAFWGSLRGFVEAGGNLVLTDRALQGLGDMGVVPAAAVTRTTQYAGSIQGISRSHELLAGVEGVIGQTYFEVPLGYPVTGGNHAPAWRVSRSAWESAGGTTAATAGGTQQTALGTLRLGEGRISVFGAVLPDATQAHAHPRGLADYAVTYAGNAILVNALTWSR